MALRGWMPVAWRRGAVALCSLTVLGLVACGDSDGSGTTRAESSSAPSSAAPESTARPAPSLTSTTATSDEPTPIPTDPAALGPCRELPENAMAGSPSRRWLTVPDGWEVRYAYTSAETPTGDAPTIRWSSLVQTDDGGRVVAVVVLDAGTPVDPVGLPSARPVTVRGVAASIGPEETRGGATGATRVNWNEDGTGFSVIARGVDDENLLALIDQVELDDGGVTSAPEPWMLLGHVATPASLDTTVLGLAEVGEPLLDTGYAPVEVAVSESAVGEPGPGVVRPPMFDPTDARLRLITVAGHPAVIADLSDGGYSVDTVDGEGHQVHASGSLPGEQLAEVAASVRPIDVDDPLLVGVPMGAVGSSPGAWCRGPR